MIAELEIETKLAAIFSQDGLTVSGALAAASAVKGVESPQDTALLAVAVAAPVYDSFLAPNCSVSVSLGLAVRRETDPSGETLLQLLSNISDILLRLQFDADYVADALTTEHFLADGASLDGGSPPTFDTAANAWTLSRTLTLKGRILFEPLAP